MILLCIALLWLIAFGIALAHRRASDLWVDLAALGALGAATTLFFWRVIFGDAWMPAGGGDLAQFLYPTYKFASDWWRRGIIPLWNPYLFGGMPFVGDIQSGVFYPLNLITFFLSNPLTFRDMEYLSILHFFGAGAGMYALLRFGRWQIADNQGSTSLDHRTTQSPNHQLSRAASLAGAVAFQFSDLFITHFGNLNLIATAAWMPLVLLCYRRALTDKRAEWAAWAGVFLAVGFLAGHAQAFLFIGIALALFTIFHLLAEGGWSRADGNSPRAMRDWRSAIGDLRFAILTALVALGLAAPVLWPVAEFAQHSTRAAFAYERAAEFSLPPAQLVGLLVPGFFGRGPQNAWGPWARVEVGYIGVLPLLLAALALVLRRDALTRFLGVSAFVGLALAMGGYAILHGWLYQFAPGFGQLRAPARFILLFDFAIATLAALGFECLWRALPRAHTLVFQRIARAAPWAYLFIAVSTGLTALAILILGQGQDPILFQRIANAANALAFFILLLGLSTALIVARATRFFRARAWAVAALALIGFDLFSLGAYVDISTDDPMRAYAHPDALAFLKSDASFYRVDPLGTGVDSIWQPDTAILYNLFDISGDNPLVLADYDRYWQALGSRSTARYDLLNAKYLIGRKNIPLDRAKFRVAYDGDPALNVYENTRALPRAFIVGAARGVDDHAQAWNAVHAQDFEPTRTVVVEKSVTGEPSTALGEQSAVKIVGYGPNEILLETRAASAGYLVLSEVYYPGWQAWVDERAVPVLRANYLFRAIELPAGAQRVRFLYDPPSFKWGLALFALTFGALGLWKMRRRLLCNQLL